MLLFGALLCRGKSFNHPNFPGMKNESEIDDYKQETYHRRRIRRDDFMGQQLGPPRDFDKYTRGERLRDVLGKCSATKTSNFSLDNPLKRRATRRARAGSVRRTGSRNRRQGSVRSGSQSSGGGMVSRRPNGQLGRGRRARQEAAGDKSGDDPESGDIFITKPPGKSVKESVLNLLYSGK